MPLEKQAEPVKKPGIGGRLAAWTGQLYLVYVMSLCMCQTAYADIFDTARDAMQKVYTDVAGLSTGGGVVWAAGCLFLIQFSRFGKNRDESRAWL